MVTTPHAPPEQTAPTRPPTPSALALARRRALGLIVADMLAEPPAPPSRSRPAADAIDPQELRSNHA